MPLSLQEQLDQCEDQIRIQRGVVRSIGLPKTIRSVYQNSNVDSFTTKDGIVTLFKTALPAAPTTFSLFTRSESGHIGFAVTLNELRYYNQPVVLLDDVPCVSETHELTTLSPEEGIEIESFVEQLRQASAGLLEPRLQSTSVGGDHDELEEQTELTVVGYRNLTDDELDKYTRLRALIDNLMDILAVPHRPDRVAVWDEASRALNTLVSQRQGIKERLEQEELKRLRRQARQNLSGRSLDGN